MPIEYLVTFLVVLLGLSLVAEPLGRLLRMPPVSLLILLGAGAAHVATLGFGLDTGLRAENFHDLVVFGLLPLLVFDAAFKAPCRALLANLGIVLFLATVGMLVTTTVSAVLLYVGIGHSSGFPWIAALLAGALLSATDPIAVVGQLRTLGAPKRLEVLLEGESLFNDATAIVVFSVFLSIAITPSAGITASGAFVDFLVMFCGGALVGMALGAIAAAATVRCDDDVAGAAITVTAAYGSFLIAESVLEVSGIMSVLGTGLLMSHVLEKGQARHERIDFLWSALAYVANGTVFLLMGATITLAMFTERWLAMLIAIGAVFVARWMTIHGGFALMNLVVNRRVPFREQTVLVWGGLRGAVTLALALALPTELEYWWTIQSMAFGVVLFTLFVQAPTTPWLLRRLGIVAGSRPSSKQASGASGASEG